MYSALRMIVITLGCFSSISCINRSEPMFHFISGQAEDLQWDANGFLKMTLRTENDSLIPTLTDIKYLDRYSDITKELKEGQRIEIKGIKDCPISFNGFLGKEKNECYIEIREFRLPDEEP